MCARAISRTPTFVCGYPGLIVSDELFASFNEQYYCPTAVEVDLLKYKHSGKMVRFTLIGDPIACGPTINDGIPSQVASKCVLHRLEFEVTN